jgi:hypothetical protein
MRRKRREKGGIGKRARSPINAKDDCDGLKTEEKEKRQESEESVLVGYAFFFCSRNIGFLMRVERAHSKSSLPYFLS